MNPNRLIEKLKSLTNEELVACGRDFQTWWKTGIIPSNGTLRRIGQEISRVVEGADVIVQKTPAGLLLHSNFDPYPAIEREIIRRWNVLNTK